MLPLTLLVPFRCLAAMPEDAVGVCREWLSPAPERFDQRFVAREMRSTRSSTLE